MRPRRKKQALLLAIVSALTAWSAPPAHTDETVSFSIHVEGLQGDLEENVKAKLELAQPQKKLTEAELRDLHENAPELIRSALQPFGYYRPVITSDLDHEGSRWRARYVVAPGPPLRVDSLDVRVLEDGAGDPVFQSVLAELPVRRGEVLVHSSYEEAKDAFTTAATRNGYLDARFARHEVQVDLERYTGAVILHYATGPKYFFGPVEFRQDVVDPELLRGYVTFSPGQPLDFNRLLELEQALGNSPYFSRVEVRPRRDLAKGNQLPIVVDLVPAKQQKYTVGVGYGTDTGPHGRGIVELRRINRRGHRGEVEGTLSIIERSAAAKYQIPWPYPRSDVLTFMVGLSRVRTETSEERTGLVGASLARMWAGWQMNFALQFRREKFDVGLDHGLSDFLVPEASWSRLRTDDPIDPTNGRRLHFRTSAAADWLLSEASYVRFEAQGKWLRSFGRHSRAIGRVGAGYLSTSRFHDLPPSVRFFAGGAQSVRGYGFNALGGRDAAGNVIGGEAMAVASVEYEYRFLDSWGAAVFYDIGNAMRRFSDPLEQGTGAGVRWRSPIGLVRVDVGVPLTEDERKLQLHLSIGPSL